MNKILFASLAFAGYVSAVKDIKGVEITHNDNLRCGRCIDGGFTYCVRQIQDNGSKKSGDPTDQKCCSDANCKYTGYGDWICSSAYVNPIYAKNICNFDTNKCGSASTVTLAKAGETANVAVNKINQGETCSYRVQTTCGAAQFTGNATAGAVSVDLLEWDSTAANLNAGVVTGTQNNKNSKNNEIKNGSPATGYPIRNATLGYILSQNTYYTTMKNTRNTTAFQNAIEARLMTAMKGLQTGYSGAFANSVWTASQAARVAKRAELTKKLNGGKGVLSKDSPDLTSNAAGKKVLETVQDGTATLTGNQMNCGNRTLFVAVTSVDSTPAEATMTFTSTEVMAPKIIQTVVDTNAIAMAASAIVGAATLMWI